MSRLFLLTMVIIALPFLFAPAVQAQIAGSVSGTIRELGTKEPLAGANIQIEGTLLGTSSDVDGRFALYRIPPGHYILKISYIGYKTLRHPLVVQASAHSSVQVELEPSFIELNQIVVTSSRLPEDLSAAAASVAVLGQETIRRRNNLSIDAALVNLAGVSLVGENINIRGGSGYNRLGGHRQLVLLDGVPIMTSDLGQVNWNIVPITEVDHIEVLKGAASSIYGSGAISGVVNILTKLPERRASVSFRQTAGLYADPAVPEWKWTDKQLHYQRTDLGYSQSFGPVGLRLALSHHSSTGDRQNGEFNRWFLTGKTRWTLPDYSSLTAFASFSSDDRELFLQWREQNQALQVPPTDVGNRYRLNGYLTYLIYDKLFSPSLSLRLRLSYNQQLVGVPFNITEAFTPALGLGGEAQFNWRPHPQHSLSFGMDYRHDRVESEFYGSRRADGISPYVQNVWHLTDRLHLNTGLRLDTYTLVGDSVEFQFSPKIGLSIQPLDGTILHTSFGRGFRAATVVERFISAGSKDFRALPNPDLMPERSTLLDIGMRQSIGQSIYCELTGFYSYYKHLIEPTLASDLTAQFKNYPAATILGIETLLRWRVWKDRLIIEASATWMDPREKESGQTLLYRPEWIGFFSPRFSWNGFFAETDFRYMSRIERVAVYPLDERVPMRVWDVRLGYNWKKYRFQVLIQNALNYHYTVSERVLGEIKSYALAVSGEI
ncbi:TonB-dependent receptor [candidate division KSB1 bacterium]|nr:TonB-dependent receptor [candidate division KSB1 bacterium]